MKSTISGIMLTLLAAGGVCTAAPDEEVIPLIQMENVPLTDALRQMAKKARLNVLLDPRLSQAPYSTMTVSIRWEKVTAREALVALLENYDLVLVESPRSGYRQ
jgi:type II secretory pathway component GspD/PulD (secretin)